MTISYLYVGLLEQGDMQKGGFQKMVSSTHTSKYFFRYMYLGIYGYCKSHFLIYFHFLYHLSSIIDKTPQLLKQTYNMMFAFHASEIAFPG